MKFKLVSRKNKKTVKTNSTNKGSFLDPKIFYTKIKERSSGPLCLKSESVISRLSTHM